MNNHLSFIASAFLIGCLAACSSSDDMPDNPTPVVNPDLIGQAMDDVTAEMQSSLYNCAQPGTRAQSDIDAINQKIPTVSEGFFNNAVPDDAKDVTASDAQLGAGSGTFVVPADAKTHDISINMGKAWDNTKGGFKDNSTVLYVEGTAKLTNTWGDGGKIIVKKGGHLIVATDDHGVHRILADGGTTIVEEGGKLTSASNALDIASNEKVYIDGDLNIDNPCIQGTLYVYGDLTGKNFINPTNKGIMDANTRLYVSGKLTSNDADLTLDGYIKVGNGIEADKHTINFQNSTKLLADCGIKAKQVNVNSNGVEVHANYIKCDNLYQCAGSKIFLEDKGFIDVADTYKNQNNGNDAAIVMEGKDAMGVLKATTIIFNGSVSTDIFFAKTNPDEGKQCLGIDCNNYKYDQNNGTYKPLEFKDVNFVKSEVERIVDGKVVDNDGLATSNVVTYSIPKDECHGNGYMPDKPVNPDTPKPVVVAESHTHDISATCVQTDGTNVYVSYHKNGNGRSGCLEVFNTTGNVTTLKQFVRDHNKAIDFNHITLDQTNKRLYAVGNNKNGGFLGYMNIKTDGLLDCTSQKMGDLDSTEIANKTYEPLRLVKLYQAQQSAAGTGSKKGGDGNCVIVNGDKLDVASTYGYEVYDNGLNPVRITKKEGRAKHLAYAPDKNTFYAIHYDGTQIVDSMTEVGLKLEKFNKSDVTMQSPVFSVDANKVKPNNGKNTVCVYDGKVYVCQSMNGLYVYDANTGAQVGHYKENIYSDKLQKDLAICANGVTVDNKYVYIAYGTRGLVILDRATLKKVTSFVAQRSANYVTLANGYIYVAYGRDCLKVFKLVE
jgi:hypothetical protein